MIGAAIGRLTAWALPALALAAAGMILWMRAELVAARADRAMLSRDLAQAEASLAQAAEAAAVHRAHIERLAADEARWAEEDRNRMSMEGRDAPLSDHMRAVAGRLWP